MNEREELRIRLAAADEREPLRVLDGRPVRTWARRHRAEPRRSCFVDVDEIEEVLSLPALDREEAARDRAPRERVERHLAAEEATSLEVDEEAARVKHLVDVPGRYPSLGDDRILRLPCRGRDAVLVVGRDLEGERAERAVGAEELEPAADAARRRIELALVDDVERSW